MSVVASISPRHQRIEAIARAVGCAAQLDHVARHETFEHVQRDVMGAEIKRHADDAVGELLRRIDRRIRRAPRSPNKRRWRGGRAAGCLAGVLHAAVIAPFAGVVHVGLALLEELAVAGERIDAFRRRHIGFESSSRRRLRGRPIRSRGLLWRTGLRRRRPVPAGPGTAPWFRERAFSFSRSDNALPRGCRWTNCAHDECRLPWHAGGGAIVSHYGTIPLKFH